MQYHCINPRPLARGGLYAWEFTRDDRSIRVQVEGQVILDSLPQRIDATEASFGLAYVPGGCVAGALTSDRLVQVLVN